MWDNLNPPRPPHGKRLLIPQIDHIAQHEPDRPWIAVPVNNSDLSQGYKNITFKHFADAINNTAHWLRANLGQSSERFPTFAYTGPPDYGYALFAAAAAKLEYQIIPFGRSIGPAAQHKIMEGKDCTIYLYVQELESVVKEVQEIYPLVRTIRVPELNEMTKGISAEPTEYIKSWEEAKDYPWLVFHTSGTTGASVWARAVPVFGPGDVVPFPSVVKAILKYSNVDGALLVPALIDALCQDPESLDLLRRLKYIQYAGAPLGTIAGKLLSSHVRLVPAIGSTDAGGYFMRYPNVSEDWDYVSLQPHTGAVMEHRVDNLYELVFIQHPRCAVQSVFEGRPDLERFETGDLWVEHHTKKGQWKLVGRNDDLIKLANGAGVLATPIELAIAEHPLVKSALVSGHGKTRLVILIEPVNTREEETRTQQGRATLVEDLKPHIEKINLQFHELAKLDTQLIVFATPDKPWPLTMKKTPMRSQVLGLYESVIEETYRNAIQK